MISKIKLIGPNKKKEIKSKFEVHGPDLNWLDVLVIMIITRAIA
jgi:hypothetical protein